MGTALIHISDLHLRQHWPEEQGVVLSEFFSDLQKQASQVSDAHVIFTGDVANSGGEQLAYEYFNDTIKRSFAEIGIPPEKLIILPGNHDLDRGYVKGKLSILKQSRRKSPTKRHLTTISMQNRKSSFIRSFGILSIGNHRTSNSL